MMELEQLLLDQSFKVGQAGNLNAFYSGANASARNQIKAAPEHKHLVKSQVNEVINKVNEAV